MTTKGTIRYIKSKRSCDIASSYLSDFLDPALLLPSVRLVAKALQPYEYEALAFRGMSGALIASPLSILTGKPLILVRKNRDCHSFRITEGFGIDSSNSFRYIVVDDLISKGNTARAIVKEIHEANPRAVCLGIITVQMVNGRINSRVKTCELLDIDKL